MTGKSVAHTWQFSSADGKLFSGAAWASAFVFNDLRFGTADAPCSASGIGQQPGERNQVAPGKPQRSTQSGQLPWGGLAGSTQE